MHIGSKHSLLLEIREKYDFLLLLSYEKRHKQTTAQLLASRLSYLLATHNTIKPAIAAMHGLVRFSD